MCKITKKFTIKTAVQDETAYSTPRRCAVRCADC